MNQFKPNGFSVKTILSDPDTIYDQVWTLTVSYLQENFALVTDKPMELTIRGFAKDKIIYLNLAVTGTIPLTCSRCGVRFQKNISDQVEQEYSFDNPDQDILPISDRLTVDLSTPLNDLIQLAVPDFPLHDPRCLGLCPVCGINLNDSPKHYTDYPDHRPNKADLANRPHLSYNRHVKKED